MPALSTQHSALSTDLVILCEQQREHVFSIGPARRGPAPCGAGFQPVFLTEPAPTAAFSVRAAKNVIAAWRRKTGIQEVVFVPARLQTVLSDDWRRSAPAPAGMVSTFDFGFSSCP